MSGGRLSAPLEPRPGSITPVEYDATPVESMREGSTPSVLASGSTSSLALTALDLTTPLEVEEEGGEEGGNVGEEEGGDVVFSDWASPKKGSTTF